MSKAVKCIPEPGRKQGFLSAEYPDAKSDFSRKPDNPNFMCKF